MERQLKTLVKNNTDKTIQIRTPDNYTFRYIYIRPNSSEMLKYDDPKFYMSSYERILYKKSGKLDLKPRSNWIEPTLPFPTTVFFNKGGADIEVVLIESNNSLVLPKGFPIRVHTPLRSFYSEFSEVIIADPIEKLVPDLGRKGLLRVEMCQNIIRKERDKREMEKLKKLREALYICEFQR